MQGMAGAHTAEASNGDLELGHIAIEELRNGILETN